MITTFALEARPQLELRASPELIAYAGLLALTAVELEQTVAREVALNPALEREDRPVCPFCGEPLGGPRCLVCMRTRGPVLDGAPPAALPAPADLLMAELRPLARRADVPVLEYVIGSLDERGFLDSPPREIAARLGVPCARVDRMVTLLRLHGPPGIAASDLRECLLLQLDAWPDDPAVALARAVVADHLSRLASGAWGAIAQALGVRRGEVAATAEFIRARLRPSASLAHTTPAPPATPDVIMCSQPDGTIAVELVEPRRLGVGLARTYVGADVGALDPEARRHVEAQLAQARTFLHRLDRRWQTMRAVAEVVLERQRAFVVHGPRQIAPLTRAQVAAQLGIHESTVSRATSGRYVLLPSGRVIAFACFFEAAQGPCAALAQLVAEERFPTPDANLAAELSLLGFPVARRTVAKYRDRLGIPPHTRRGRERTFAPAAVMRSDLREARL